MLMRDIHFANGVAVSQDGSFVVVAGTFDKKIFRHWLTGPKQGTNEVFVDTLPGTPDGVSLNPRGNFWVAIFLLDNAAASRFIAPLPWVKGFAATFLTGPLLNIPAKIGAILEVHQNGTVLRGFYDPSGKVAPSVTSVIERDDKLYLGSFHDYIAVKEL